MFFESALLTRIASRLAKRGPVLLRRRAHGLLNHVPAYRWLDDLLYIRRMYRQEFGSSPNLLFPTTFNEHINHKMLFDRRRLLTTLTDKYEVREYVRQRVGADYLVPLLLVARYPDELDFGQLPARFVIKATHGSGWNIIVSDKARVNEAATRRQLAHWLSLNYYDFYREWGYRNIEPRFIVEQFIGDDLGNVPWDYKIYCFDGLPTFVQLHLDRFGDHRLDIYDTTWSRLPMRKSGHPNTEAGVPAPHNLDEMMLVAEKLARGLDFVRVDLYSADGRLFFGELTSYPNRGRGAFQPPEFDTLFGTYWPSSPWGRRSSRPGS